MPAYLVVQYTCADLAAAKAVWANFDPGDFANNEHAVSVHDTPPVILAGLVKGGEYATVDEWLDSGSETLCIAADGRIVSTEDNEDALAAEARGALPITWYYYEAP